jgi:hypothetical protein
MRVLADGRARWAALGAIVGALAAGGIAWADIPDSGVIHGCYKTVGGSLRVIDASAGRQCTAGEKSLDWDQKAAESGSTTFPNSTETLFALDNGVTVAGRCADAVIELTVSPATPLGLQLSGTTNSDQLGFKSPSISHGETLSVAGVESVNVDALARDSTVGTFAHIDVHGAGSVNTPCTFWWMITRSG